MVMKKTLIIGEGPVIQDEGWWASVLADEELVNGREGSAKPAAAAALVTVDWDKILHIYDNDEIIELEVKGFNRGGLLVGEENLQGFVPISHLIDVSQVGSDEERMQSLARYVSQKLQLKVIECDPSQERVVFSERAALAGEGRRKYLFRSLKTGDTVSGTVTNVTDFGVFVDLGGLEGLIHVSELSWGRVHHPCEILKVNDPVKTMVLQVSEENGRVALSLKRLHDNPWESITDAHRVGDIVSATVTSLARFGVFARLKEGVEGLIHISSLGGSDSVGDLPKSLAPGQRIQVRILHIDPEKRRLGLSLAEGE